MFFENNLNIHLLFVKCITRNTPYFFGFDGGGWVGLGGVGGGGDAGGRFPELGFFSAALVTEDFSL
jgi:hypothetical protein